MKCPIPLVFLLKWNSSRLVVVRIHLISGCCLTICKYFQPQQDDGVLMHAFAVHVVFALVTENFCVD